MKLTKILSIIILAAAGVAALASCGSSRKAAAPTETPVLPVISGERTPESDFRAMTGAYRPWSDLTVPVKVSMRSPRSFSASGTLTMAYGRAVSLTVKMLFIEAASLYADNDSVIILSKPLGAAYVASMKKFTEATGMDLRDLQSLLIGQAFEPGKGTATPSSEKYFTLSDMPLGEGYDDYAAINITPRKMPAGIDWNFCAVSLLGQSEQAPRLASLGIRASGCEVEVSFSGAVDTPAGPVPEAVNFAGTVRKTKLDVEVTASESRARWNSGAEPKKISIPRNVRRMTTAQLLNLLKK